MKERNFAFVEEYLLERYLDPAAYLWIPPPMSHREFGFVLGPNKAMTRHHGFENEPSLRRFLASEAPLDAYHSAAIYDNPTASMDEKGFKGADVFFDIDADHVDPPCASDSTVWICNSCGDAGLGSSESCRRCKRNVDYVTFPNARCIDVARKETQKLVDILEQDFGLPQHEIKVHYSGNRGFHVYAFSEDARTLGQDARKDVIDYLLDPSSELDLLAIRTGPNAKELSLPRSGLPGRILQEMKNVVPDKDLLAGILGPRLAQRVSKNSGLILLELERGVLTGLVKAVGAKNIQVFFKQVLVRTKVKVDPVVTIDLHRLVRMPGTINSKTGFPKTEVDLTKTRGENVLSDVHLSTSSVKLAVKAAPRLELGGASFGPYENLIVDLPTEVAVLLVLRGVAEVIG